MPTLDLLAGIFIKEWQNAPQLTRKMDGKPCNTNLKQASKIHKGKNHTSIKSFAFYALYRREMSKKNIEANQG